MRNPFKTILDHTNTVSIIYDLPTDHFAYTTTPVLRRPPAASALLRRIARPRRISPRRCVCICCGIAVVGGSPLPPPVVPVTIRKEVVIRTEIIRFRRLRAVTMSKVRKMVLTVFRLKVDTRVVGHALQDQQVDAGGEDGQPEKDEEQGEQLQGNNVRVRSSIFDNLGSQLYSLNLDFSCQKFLYQAC